MQQAIVFAFLAAIWAGCTAFGTPSLEPCDTKKRAAQAGKIEALNAAVRDSVVRSFKQKNRIMEVGLSQQECHFNLSMRVEPITSEEYGRLQAETFIRQVKKHAPGETPPMPKWTGKGLYDFVITVHKDTIKGWIKGSKLYDEHRILWSR